MKLETDVLRLRGVKLSSVEFCCVSGMGGAKSPIGAAHLAFPAGAGIFPNQNAKEALSTRSRRLNAAD